MSHHVTNVQTVGLETVYQVIAIELQNHLVMLELTKSQERGFAKMIHMQRKHTGREEIATATRTGRRRYDAFVKVEGS